MCESSSGCSRQWRSVCLLWSVFVCLYGDLARLAFPTILPYDLRVGTTSGVVSSRPKYSTYLVLPSTITRKKKKVVAGRAHFARIGGGVVTRTGPIRYLELAREGKGQSAFQTFSKTFNHPNRRNRFRSALVFIPRAFLFGLCCEADFNLPPNTRSFFLETERKINDGNFLCNPRRGTI